jgi:hypothetical protein
MNYLYIVIVKKTKNNNVHRRNTFYCRLSTCVSQSLNIPRYDVINNNPTTIRSTPIIFCAYLTMYPYLLRNPNNRSKRIADIRNGMASPKEYMLNKKAPYHMLSAAEEMSNIEESAGPMQGVQPREKATPTTKAPKTPAGFSFR